MAAEEPEAKRAKTSAKGSEWLEKPVPDVSIDLGFGNPGNVKLSERCADKKVILVGLPGAFTPT